MAKINIKPKGTIEASIQECLDLTEGDETVEISRWTLQQWLEKARNTGMSLEQEQRAAARIREQVAEKDATIKELRLELGRYMDAVDADGDGTAVDFASKKEVERETEALLESDKELLERLAE